MTGDLSERLLTRARELKREGVDWFQAHGVAWLEERIRQWPAAWGDDLQILIYGDFDPPDDVLEIPSLGITIFPEKQLNSVIKTAMCVLKATVKLNEKSVPALIEAGRRINVFLGAYTLVEWGNAGSGWWSWVTHGTGGGVGTKIGHGDIPRAIEGILSLQPDVKQRLDAALYWVREPRNLLLEFYRSDVLRIYSCYWNAFECLVEAFNIVKPLPKLTRNEKQSLIDEFVARKAKRLTAADIEDCYQFIVNPGFVGKASHALTVCFGEEAGYYIKECFKLADKKNRLYDIRNAINHGDIDAEHPEELIRVESRLHRLWMIVWRMFGRLVPFSAPMDSELKVING